MFRDMFSEFLPANARIMRALISFYLQTIINRSALTPSAAHTVIFEVTEPIGK